MLFGALVFVNPASVEAFGGHLESRLESWRGGDLSSTARPRHGDLACEAPAGLLTVRVDDAVSSAIPARRRPHRPERDG